MAQRILFALIVSLSLLLPSVVRAEVVCEELPQDLCAYAVSSSYKRCVLESYQRGGGKAEYQCRTSGVAVDSRLADYVETDECVHTCGVDRYTVGISSDALLESQFTARLCSPQCYNSCPNIMDLYFNLAAGEGVFLPGLCAATRENPNRAMLEILSSGAASGPVGGGGMGQLDEITAPAPLAGDDETDQMYEISVALSPAPVADGDTSQAAYAAPAPAPSPFATYA